MYHRLMMGLGLCLTFGSAQAMTPQAGPLASYDAQVFLQLSQDAQKVYVAGVMDGFAFVNYSHGFAAYDTVVKCIKSKPTEYLTAGVVEWLKAHPDFNEGLSSAVIQSVSAYCA